MEINSKIELKMALLFFQMKNNWCTVNPMDFETLSCQQKSAPSVEIVDRLKI